MMPVRDPAPRSECALARKATRYIADIAGQHAAIAVSRDDPILIPQTMNRRLMQSSAAAHQAALERFEQTCEALTHRWTPETRRSGPLNAALATGWVAMRDDMEAGAKATTTTVRQALETALAPFAATLPERRRIAVMNLIAAGMTVFAAALALLPMP